MYFGRGQITNRAVDDELDRHDLEPLNPFKDLGIVHDPEMKLHGQVDAAVNAAFLIRRVIRHLPLKVFLRAFA